jgi:hypothetical protein
MPKPPFVRRRGEIFNNSGVSAGAAGTEPQPFVESRCSKVGLYGKNTPAQALVREWCGVRDCHPPATTAAIRDSPGIRRKQPCPGEYSAPTALPLCQPSRPLKAPSEIALRDGTRGNAPARFVQICHADTLNCAQTRKKFFPARNLRQQSAAFRKPLFIQRKCQPPRPENFQKTRPLLEAAYRHK